MSGRGGREVREDSPPAYSSSPPELSSQQVHEMAREQSQSPTTSEAGPSSPSWRSRLTRPFRRSRPTSPMSDGPASPTSDGPASPTSDGPASPTEGENPPPYQNHRGRGRGRPLGLRINPAAENDEDDDRPGSPTYQARSDLDPESASPRSITTTSPEELWNALRGPLPPDVGRYQPIPDIIGSPQSPRSGEGDESPRE